MKFLVPIILLFLSWNLLVSEDYKRFGVNFSNTIGLYSLSSNLSEEADIVESIERYSVSYHTDFEHRHLVHKTNVVFKFGYSNYHIKDYADMNNLNSIDLQISFGDIYGLNESFLFFFFAGGHISYVYNAPVNSPIRTANGIPFISTGLYYNIFSGLELKAEIQSGLFSYRLLGFIPSYEFGLVWRIE